MNFYQIVEFIKLFLYNFVTRSSKSIQKFGYFDRKTNEYKKKVQLLIF